MYEHDCVADLAADAFNVFWFRSSPTAFSLCNDFNLEIILIMFKVHVF